jgi:hypothetical protein
VFAAFLNPVTTGGGEVVKAIPGQSRGDGAKAPRSAKISTSPTVAAPSRLQPQNNAR